MTTITTSHFRFYVTVDGRNVATFRSLAAAVKAYPQASIEVPEAMLKSFQLSQKAAN